MSTESTDEFNLAEIRFYLRGKTMSEKTLEESMTETLADAWVSIFFRCSPDGFICEITDTGATWAGWGKTMRAAYDMARSRTVSK